VAAASLAENYVGLPLSPGRATLGGTDGPQAFHHHNLQRRQDADRISLK
jgi:hypothetical protein